MIIDAKSELKENTPEDFGIILKDINNDNIDELFLVRNDHNILAIFTLIDNSPKLLDAFWSKYKAVMLDNIQIYTLNSSSANTFEYSIKKLNNDGDELIITKSFGCDNGTYYTQNFKQKETIEVCDFENIIFLNPFENSQDWCNTPIIFL